MGKRLHIGNLPSSATAEELLAKFAQFGTVESAQIVRDAGTGRSRRFGIVEMANDAAAEAAIRRLNLTQYDDMTMSVSRARDSEKQLMEPREASRPSLSAGLSKRSSIVGRE